MPNGFAVLANAVTASISVPAGPPYHDGYAPNPPVSTLEPFRFDTADPDAGAVTFDTANSVPAFARGLALISHTIASFPLEEWRDGRRQPRRPLFDQPDVATTRQATLARTVEDMVCYGVGYWLTTERDAATGKPRRARWLDAATVHVDEHGRYTDGRGHVMPARDVIRFDYARSGALARGARILSTAAALEDAARRYARTPAPRTVLAGNGDVPLPTADARAVLNSYLDAIRATGAAYVDNIDLKQIGWSSSELQLTEARQYTAAAVANMLNLDPVWVGATIPGSSLTYQNRQDLYRGLIDLSLRGLLNAIEQRLTGDDVTEHGRAVRFNLDAFLRGNANERTDIVTRLYPDLITRDEARAILDITPEQDLETENG